MNTNKKLDNKGFSLVELIIVIAIMAILVGVVGTQVIPYIEKSRQSKDLQIISGFCTNMTSAAANCAAVIDATKDYRIEITLSSGTLSTINDATSGLGGSGGTTGNQDLLDNFAELCGATLSGSTWTMNQNFESKAAKGASGPVRCTLTQSGTTGNGVVVELVGQTNISKVSSK